MLRWVQPTLRQPSSELHLMQLHRWIQIEWMPLFKIQNNAMLTKLPCEIYGSQSEWTFAVFDLMWGVVYVKKLSSCCTFLLLLNTIEVFNPKFFFFVFLHFLFISFRSSYYWGMWLSTSWQRNQLLWIWLQGFCHHSSVTKINLLSQRTRHWFTTIRFK